ncbi:ABC transporter ATP-binding protein [Mucilaginibacter sp.]|uniref:ABC transporter ATP-binding protein n=1 Tax=Mucilaginibacter sp. TaxID=1882438 RepID=UPI000CB094E5|nr:ABC transporter ATP-binding protein [Mucilaginibacter sp.]PLW90363.1 MAG: glycine/betaine ABC transporter ATP-binding protein [Mucilaginibacter sp.]HEK21959.1 ABC transporter ATP-binding protein [Bacteroidota bacterium]
MIKVSNLIKTFGQTHAVNNISFEVAKGETLALLGTSGCGKTTTLKMLNRLIEPDSGTIEVDGQKILSQAPELLRRSIGYVLQNNGLFPHYTVAENIAIVPNLLKWDKAKVEARTNELLDKLHLPKEYLNAYPAGLSGGQQQRVGLARALVADAPVLLMDEPFGALDNVTRSKIHAEFKVLDELKRKTIIMVTHDVQEAFLLADRIALMDKGQIVQIGTASELLFNPANDFVKDFLKEQHLQLELKTIKLNDIWQYLPADGRRINTSQLAATAGLWEALDTFKFYPRENINIINQQTREVRSVTFDQLMSAYSCFKNQVPHE